MAQKKDLFDPIRSKGQTAYERAYREYRFNRFEHCMDLLSKIPNQDYKVMDLMAQAYFKQKRYQEAYDTYLKIIESGQDPEHDTERQENIAAIVISAQLETPDTLLTRESFFKELPSVEEIIESIDILSIKDEDWFVGTKFVKKVTGKRGAASKRAAPSTGKSKSTSRANDLDPNDENAEPSKIKRKRQKKRKKRLPKNFDPVAGPDPERWLPKWQRSNYNARRKDKQRSQQALKGTQGAVSEAEAIVPKQPKAAAPVAGSSQGPRQMRPTAQKKKKKTGKR